MNSLDVARSSGESEKRSSKNRFLLPWPSELAQRVYEHQLLVLEMQRLDSYPGQKNGALNLDRYNVPRTKRINESTTLLAHGFAPF